MHEKIKPFVFAVVLHYLNEADTSECISSLLAGGINSSNLIIVDNASPNNSLTTLKNTFPELTFLQTVHNLGNAGGLNVGIRFALLQGAEFILLSDNDVIYTEDFLEPLIKSLTDNSDAGIASPKILYHHNKDKIYCAGGKLSYVLCSGLSENRGKDSSIIADKTKEISFAEGCSFLVKREVFERLGYLDEKFFMYYEDFEFSERVGKSYKIIFNCNSLVYHKCGAGVRWSNYSPLYYYFSTRNRFMVFLNKRLFYKIYVTLFSTINSLAKLIVLSCSYLFVGKKTETECIKSLWNGYSDGLKLMFIKMYNND